MSEKKLAKVFYADLWGLREEKYKFLFKNDAKTTKWQKLEPVSPYCFFVPKDFALQGEYDNFWKVTDIFKEWSSGVKTNRDHFLVDFSKQTLIRRISDMLSPRLNDELFNTTYGLEDGKYWDIKREREKVRNNPNYKIQFHPYFYRPFDIRWIFYQPNLIEIGRGGASKEISAHLFRENYGLTVTRLLSSENFFHTFVTTNITDMCLLSTKTKETTYVFPLYIYPDEPRPIHELPLQSRIKTERTTNLTPGFLQAFSARIGIHVGAGLAPVQKEKAFTRVAPTTEIIPEEIFCYIYAVLYSPTYRKRYEEFLKIDFPRVPLPSNYKIFKELSHLGKNLVDLHLLKHPELDKTEIGVSKEGSNAVEKVSYDEKNQRVYINHERYFEGILKEVWEYRIGAYQVMEKYLKDRKGRKLSLDEMNHYMKMAKALLLTIELQKKIDDIYRKTE